jgi:hypothetical protein
MSDFHVVGFGYIKIGVYISFSINNNSYSGLLATNEVTGLCQTFVVNVLKKHLLF